MAASRAAGQDAVALKTPRTFPRGFIGFRGLDRRVLRDSGAPSSSCEPILPALWGCRGFAPNSWTMHSLLLSLEGSAAELSVISELVVMECFAKFNLKRLEFKFHLWINKAL